MAYKASVSRIRDLFAGLNILGAEPMANHLLNFRIKQALSGMKPIIDGLSKTEEELLKTYTELAEDGKPRRDDRGQPIFKEPRAESEAGAVKDLKEVLEEELELPASVKPLTWSMLEKTKCVWTDKETGERKEGPLVVSVQVQLLLGDFIEGEPAEDTDAAVKL